MYEYDRSIGYPQTRLRDPRTLRYVDRWQNETPLKLLLPNGRLVTVPAGFVHDKASVPRLAWWYLPRDDKRVIDAALVHDWLYSHQRIEGEWIARSEADKIFLDLLRQEGMSWFKSWAAYAAVKSWGWRYWNPRAKAMGNPL